MKDPNSSFPLDRVLGSSSYPPKDMEFTNGKSEVLAAKIIILIGHRVVSSGVYTKQVTWGNFTHV